MEGVFSGISAKLNIYHSPYISVGVSEVMAVGIQGKVDICIQGQRLNQTKEERAGVVYGADHRLSWTVAAPMPKIVVSQSSTASMQPQLQLFPYVYMYGFTCTCNVHVEFFMLGFIKALFSTFPHNPALYKSFI